MYEPKYAKDIRCPLEYGLKVFGGKWKSRIICVLAEKKKLRYSALRRDMANISDAILAATLKELIADQLVAREQFNEIPPRVEYRLTEKGESVVPILQSICRWAGLYERGLGDVYKRQVSEMQLRLPQRFLILACRSRAQQYS